MIIESGVYRVGGLVHAPPGEDPAPTAGSRSDTEPASTLPTGVVADERPTPPAAEPEAALDLVQVLVELAAKVGQPQRIGRLEFEREAVAHAASVTMRPRREWLNASVMTTSAKCPTRRG